MTFSNKELSTVFGMVKRGDNNHDIAAWFGVNQGRVAEAKNGDYGIFPATPPEKLPPKGAPGIKGRRLYRMTAAVLEQLKTDGGTNTAISSLEAAIAKYNKNDS